MADHPLRGLPSVDTLLGEELGANLVERHGRPATVEAIRAALAGARGRGVADGPDELLAEAARLLGRRYSLEGRVVHGEGIGRTLGVPTANLRLHEEKLLPRFGIYTTWVRIGGEDRWRPGAMSLGVRPTFGGQATTLEVHLLDWDGDLYGRELEIELQDWMREQRAFDGPEALIAAMQADLDDARRRLVRRDEPSAAASA